MSFALPLLGACSLLVDTSGLAGAVGGDDAGPDVTVPDADDDWLDPAWAARRAIVVPAARMVGEVRDFPVLVDLSARFDGTRPRDDGLDFRFTAEDKRTPLPHELVSPRAAWVKVPKLDGTTDTRFYVYYGNPAFAERAPASAVWDGQYEAVWHLDESGASPYRDATSHGQDGSSNAVAPIAGKVAGAQQFGGRSQISFPMVSAIGITSTYSFSAWILSDTATTAAIADGTIGLHFTFERQSSGVLDAIAYEGCGSPNWPANKVSGTKQTTTGTWVHAALVTNGTATATFVDGLRDGQRTLAAATVTNTYESLRLGLPDCNNDGFYGRIDEVRLTKRALDDAWIRAEFDNQSSPSTFATIQAEERR